MLPKEGMTTVKARNALSVPHSTKRATPPKYVYNINKED